MSLNETPVGDRTKIAVFGRRNAGKSTLVNAMTGQEVAIVSEVAGTTTDPVAKAMELAPLGPCLIVDTAGLDDVGALGAERVRRTLETLETTDIAVWVDPGDTPPDPEFLKACENREVPLVIYRRGEDVEAFKRKLAAMRPKIAARPLLEGLVTRGDKVICVCPIDGSAPVGRLILPQQQVIRALLDAGASAIVCQPGDQVREYCQTLHPQLVITDSQAFREVAAVVPKATPLTSFSILFARAKGDLAVYLEGARAIGRLQDGDRVLIAEGCTHHRQCEDIGTVKLPRRLLAFTGRQLEFEFVSGAAFPAELSRFRMVIQCGGCMLTRRTVLNRIARCRAAEVPVTNYGLALALTAGLDLSQQLTGIVRG